ncbi:MAG: hypothetical protein MUF43_03650 [Flavobacterium sp.]|jgi:hypothetical protein|nr:hypothetical protein [Flavobacterium sp.]MCU0470236.1 hypothetical protein [Arcicella sp.]
MKKLLLFLLTFFVYSSVYCQKTVVIFASIDDYDDKLNSKFQRNLNTFFRKQYFKKKVDFINYTKSISELKDDSTCINLLIDLHKPDYFIYIKLIEQREVEKKEKPLILKSSADLLRDVIHNGKPQTVIKKKYSATLREIETKDILSEFGLVFEKDDFTDQLGNYKVHLKKIFLE